MELELEWSSTFLMVELELEWSFAKAAGVGVELNAIWPELPISGKASLCLVSLEMDLFNSQQGFASLEGSECECHSLSSR